MAQHRGTGRDRPSVTPRKWRWVRRLVQVLALSLFVYLLMDLWLDKTGGLADDFFFRLDPLVGLSVMLAGREWLLPLALGALTLALTLFMGRVWCGWICPLGTVLDWTSWRRFGRPAGPPSGWHQAKYFVLAATVIAALAGSLSLLILDPLTLLYRTASSAILPGMNTLITWCETRLYDFEPLRGPLDAFDGAIRGTLLPAAEPFYLPGLVLVAFFLGILALNAIRPRFWCRYVCPLGALLGLGSRFARFRRSVDEAGCIACHKCARECTVDAIDPDRCFTSHPSECTLCLNCVSACPVDAVKFQLERGSPVPAGHGLQRRQFLASVGAVLSGVLLLRMAPFIQNKESQALRPPGATGDLMNKCTRCGECINVCPTRALQPGLAEAGYDALWTPVFVPRVGYCDFSCHECGRVCPTLAIPELSLDGKRQTVMGQARIDRQSCIPWAQGMNCIVCQEMCPLPDKAIRLEEQEIINSEGKQTAVLLPKVISEKCIGCGICENQCPVNGQAAIRVFPPESV
jgi:MauM/NapG family ferredoxin protein